MKTIEKRLDDILKVQCMNGNWNYDPYMHGMANGLILAQSIVTEKEPQFLNAPKQWLREHPKEGASPEPQTSDNKALNTDAA